MALNHDQAKVIRLTVKHKTLREFNHARLENHLFNVNNIIIEIYIIFVCLSFFSFS